ncbi:TPA: hypothetical protein NHR53_006212 [Pseudomonas aeruginosa]|uniref:hypothetical protein n=1 Tax=Pseudomonas aeruginosa TaxID=287 RepID=UPI0008036BC2|nr:hypothetical protein [Pseudomonas aeruginosa]OBY20761.1 hypothetical protein A8O37_25560 [Pseudomonas aeruginosa]HCE7248310.1 hypothetical protein [Pseudomonas aeruginosa]HCE8129614.1 hypothetical protein [Pseudomonas aeruginosa]HCF0447750.1 hypothetical protein [Pseudomonas aeruginosa]
MATESELQEAFDAGAASAKALLAESENPLMMTDELHDDELSTANAMGWNSVWASEENSRRWAALRDANQIAKGKTQSFDKLRKHLAERQIGLRWKDAWALRLSDLGGSNRLPRGFNAKNLSERAAGREVLRQIKQAATGIYQS